MDNSISSDEVTSNPGTRMFEIIEMVTTTNQNIPTSVEQLLASMQQHAEIGNQQSEYSQHQPPVAEVPESSTKQILQCDGYVDIPITLQSDGPQLDDPGNHQSKILPNQQVAGSGPEAEEPEPCEKQIEKCDKQQLEDPGNHPSEGRSNQQVAGTTPKAGRSKPFKKRTWQCDKCGKIYKAASAIKAHMELVHEGVLHACEICGVTLRWKTNLKSHMRSVHNISGPLRKLRINRKCQQCGIKFTSNYLLYHHLRTVHNESKPCKCPVCSEGFKTTQEMYYHKLTHGELVGYSCKVCGLRYVTKLNFQKHIEKTKHQQKMDEDNLVAESKEKQSSMACFNCKKQFTNYTAFYHHCKNTACSSTLDKKYKCKHCKQLFHLRDNLREHLRSVHNKRSVNKVQPVDNVLRKKTKRKFPCPVCKKMIDNSGLKYHEKKHGGIKDYACDECDYKCILPTDLQKHKNLHRGIKPYQCKFCSRQLNSKTELAGHENFHVGHKPFKCQLCERRFFGNDSRLHHQRNCVMGRGNTVLYTKKDKPIAFRCRYCRGIFPHQHVFTKHEKKCQSQTREHLSSQKGQDQCVSNEYQSQNEPPSQNEPQSQNEPRTGEGEVLPFDSLPSCTFCSEICRDQADVSNHEKTCFRRKPQRKQPATVSDKPKSGNEGKDWGNSESNNERKAVFIPCMAFCSTCGKSTVELVKEHCPLHKVSCPACQTVFESEQELEAHLSSAHSDEQRHLRSNPSYAVCISCGKTTAQVLKENHLHQFMCICRSVFDSKEHFDAHRAVCVGRVKSNLYACVHCSETFYSKQVLEEHKQVVHSEVIYECCNKRFALQDFRNHLQSRFHTKQISSLKRGASFAFKQRSPGAKCRKNDTGTAEVGFKSINAKQAKSVNQEISDANLTKAITSKPSSSEAKQITVSATPGKKSSDEDKLKSGEPAKASSRQQIVIVTPRKTSSVSKSENGTPAHCLFKMTSQGDILETQLKTDGKTEVQSSAPNVQMNPVHLPGVSTSKMEHTSLPSTKHGPTTLPNVEYVPKETIRRHTNKSMRRLLRKVVVAYQCSFCKDIFSIQRNLLVHLRTHKDQMPFACSYCIMSYETKTKLEAHMADKHKEIWKLLPKV